MDSNNNKLKIQKKIIIRKNVNNNKTTKIIIIKKECDDFDDVINYFDIKRYRMFVCFKYRTSFYCSYKGFSYINPFRI